MKKIINEPKEFAKETLEGIYAAHPPDLTHVNEDLHCLVKKTNQRQSRNHDRWRFGTSA